MKNFLVAVFILILANCFIACSSSEDDSCTETTWYQDFDSDNLGNPDVSIEACEQPSGYVSNNSDTDDSDCESDQVLDSSRGACNETLAFANSYNQTILGNNRIITSNSIPEHMVGRFGMGSGSLNPNAISEQNETYTITMNPMESASLTALLSTTGIGPNAGPQYSFGVLLNGVELDPVAAEPFPHEGMMNPNVNWEWNLEALNVNLGLDCNNAHVQPTGKYHYHGSPILFLEALNAPTDTMTLIGYAADGFPIYYKYAYSDATDNNSSVVAMSSSYQLKSGARGGDGVTAPCGTYDGVYSNDYEYVSGLGSLDEANGRIGITPEYPSGTFYYVITDEFPSIPRFFKGTPSQDFRVGM
ncbi:YHYH protein [Winogradskyella sp.]|uniref:YHYH protein n=1 Tax=Winogradskyella sp. TaxID=1883156 RepID=UPI0025F85B66|nr:YHYH protein [Winogradskyella sp.]